MTGQWWLKIYGRRGSDGGVSHGFLGRRGRTPDLRELLQVGGSVDPPIWRRYLVHVPYYLEDPWRVPPHGDPSSDGNSTEAGHDEQVGLSTDGRGNDGNGFGVGGDVRTPPPE